MISKEKKMTSRTALTPEEHGKYVHLCGKTGEEIELTRICKKCKRENPELFKQCLQSHAVVGLDGNVTEEQIEETLNLKRNQ